MIICSKILWVGSIVVSQMLGEIEFDQFRQLKNREVKELLTLIREDPLDAVQYFNLGVAYMAMGRHREEIDSYLEAISLNSNYAQAHFNLSIVYDTLKNGKEAISHARKAENLYNKKNHRQVRKIRRQLIFLSEKYK